MLEFRDILLTDKQEFEQRVQVYSFMNCDYSFNDLYLWRHYYQVKVSFNDNTLFIQVFNQHHILFYPPIGNIQEGIEILTLYTRKHNIPLIFTSIEGHFLNYFSKSIYHIQPKRGNADYIYLKNDLIHLDGSKYKQKRNFVKGFFKEPDIETFTLETLRHEDLRIVHQWFTLEHNEDKGTYGFEKQAILDAIKFKDELGILGFGIRVKKKAVALALGTIVGDTFICHFEKADIKVRGAFQAINYLTAKRLPSEIKYINREEDMDIPSLRRAKLSYHPYTIAMNYNAYFIRDYSFQIKKHVGSIRPLIQLWADVFKDGMYSKWFLKNVKQKTIFVASIANQIVGMIVVVQGNYAYALAVDKEYRNLGIGSLLIDFVVQKYPRLFLLLEEDSLAKYYERFGFKKSIRGYATNYEIKDIDYSVPLKMGDLHQMIELYNSIPFEKLPRDVCFYDLYLSQPNIHYRMNEYAYAIYYIEDDSLLVAEFVGEREEEFINQLLLLENKQFAKVISYQGVEELYVFQNYEDSTFVYKNLLFN